MDFPPCSLSAAAAAAAPARAPMRTVIGTESKAQLSPEAAFITPLIESAVQGCGNIDASQGADGGKWVSYPCVINALGNFDGVAMQSAATPLAQCMSLDGFVIDKGCVLDRVRELQGQGVQFTDRQVLTKTGFMTDTDRSWRGLADVEAPTHGPMAGMSQELPQRGALRATRFA